MVTQPATRRKPRPLITAALLQTAAAHGTGLDTRHIDHWHPNCESRAILRAQAEGLRAYHVATNHWVVPSGTTPGKAYDVHVWDGRPCCTCPAGLGRKMCKHSAAVARALALGVS